MIRLSHLLFLLFVFVSLVLLAAASGLFYRTASRVVDSEVSRMINQTHKTIDLKFETFLSSIETAVNKVALDPEFIRSVVEKQQKEAENRLAHIYSAPGERIYDVLFIKTADNPVWVDLSSRFNISESTLHLISQNVEPHLKWSVYSGEPLSGSRRESGKRLDRSGAAGRRRVYLVHSVVLSDPGTAGTKGVVFIGMRMDGRSELLAGLRNFSHAAGIIISLKDKEIASSFEHARYLEPLYPELDELQLWQHRRIQNHIVSKRPLSGLPSLSDMRLTLLLSDVTIRSLAAGYRRDIPLLLCGILLICFLVALTAKYLTDRSLGQLVRYTRAVKSGEKSDYRPGMIREFDDIHDVLQSTVKSLHDEYKGHLAARRSIKRFQEQLEITSDFVSMADRDGRMIYLNRAGRAMTGYGEDEEITRCLVGDFFPLVTVDAVTGKERTSALDKPAWTEETLLLTRDGTEIPVSLVFVTHKSPAGEIEIISSIARDITRQKRFEKELTRTNEQLREEVAERKRAEEELRLKNVTLVTQQETSADGILVVNEEGRIVSFNRRFVEMWGIPSHVVESGSDEQALGFVLDKLVEPDEFIERVKYLYSHKDEKSWEEIALIGDITFERYSAPMHGTDGEYFGRVWYFREITKRKRAEKELRHLRNLLSNIIDSMPSIIVGVDSGGRVTQWNKEAEKSSGVAPKDAEGSLLVDIFPRLSGEMEKVRKAIENRKPLKNRKVPSSLHGETRYSDITVYPLIENRVGGAVIRMDDVTEQVRTEEVIIQTEKMMSVGGLAAGMAHEINNPLSGILQAAQMVLQRISPEYEKNLEVARECGSELTIIREYLEKRKVIAFMESIRESGTRATGIVDNMLRFSRRSEARKEPVELPVLMERTVELCSGDYDLKRKYDFRKIEIIREFDPDLPSVPCAETEITQVLLNLLKNAAEAMKEMLAKKEPSRIILRLRKENAYARIEVEDNGPGMDEAVRKRIFEPFFTTKDIGRGTGLGLSVSYFIITENHSGTMAVESTPGMGTKFLIRLPLNEMDKI